MRRRPVSLGRFDSHLRACDVLACGGLVAALADRTENAASLASALFGGPTPFPIGPHALAARAGATALMGFGLYEGGTRYGIEFTECGAAAPVGSRGAGLQPEVGPYVAVLEAYARRYSRNGFNFLAHRGHT